MTQSAIEKSLLIAGTKIRDQAILHTGQMVWRHPVETKSFSAYGGRQVDVTGSRVESWLIISWDDAAFDSDIVDFSEESTPYIEAFARMCDDWKEGDVVETDTTDIMTGVVSTQQFKVSAVKITRKQFTMVKSIGLVPYRTDNF